MTALILAMLLGATPATHTGAPHTTTRNASTLVTWHAITASGLDTATINR